MGRLLLFLILLSLFTLSFLSGKLHKPLKLLCQNFHGLLEFGPSTCRGTISIVRDRQQVPPHDMAGTALRRELAAAPHHRFRPRERQVEDPTLPESLVGTDMGADPLRP